MMRTFTFFTATLGLAALLGACSDGSGLVPGAGGTGDTSNTTNAVGGQSTAGSGTVIPNAGTSNTTAGTAATTGGTGTTTAGTSSGGSDSTAGTSSGGTGTTTGGTDSGGGTGGTPPVDPYSGPFKILVLSTTLDFHHDSIPICDLMVGVESVRAAVEADRGKQQPNLGALPDTMPVGTKPGSSWTADLATDDLAQFTDEGLKPYAMVFSCNPTGTVFSNNPKVKDKAVAMAALQKFVENGGAWGGVHSATDFEKTNGYPWFINTLVGAYFDHHDNDGTSGTVQIQNMFTTHPVMKDMPATWSTSDEWYYMNRDVSAQPGFQILERLASDNRPVTWVKEFGMGRMFYTIRGHNKNVYDKEPDFRKLVRNGILWATHRLN
jgi:type 1 glutamine amidotransferase